MSKRTNNSRKSSKTAPRARFGRSAGDVPEVDTAPKARKARKAKAAPAPEQTAPESLSAPRVLAREHVTTTAKAASHINEVASDFATVGYHIEKDRPSAHGVTRASTNTACETVWALCDELKSSLGRIPLVGEVRDAGAALGLNKNNIQIEFYRWRKFQGIRGRCAPDGGVKRSRINKVGKDLAKAEEAKAA